MGQYNDTGFQSWSLQEWVDYINEQAKLIMGETVDLTPSAPLGNIIQLLAQNEVVGDEIIEQIYWARDVDNASELALTKLCAETGTKRNKAIPTQVENVWLIGDEGSIVPSDAVAKQPNEFLPDPDLVFTNQVDVAITKTNCVYILLSLSEPANGTIYTITIDGVTHTQTADGTSTKASIISGFDSQISDVAIENINDNISIIFEKEVNCAFNNSFTQEEVASLGSFVANISGAISCAANTLIEIVTSETGWNRINNIEPGVLGRVIETDIEIRIRRNKELIGGKATEQAIEDALTDVEDVSLAIVASNRTMNYIDGQPPKSVEAIVSGGNEDEIAQAIYDNVGGGIEYFGRGGYEGTAIDENGEEVTIPFSRPSPIYIWIRFTREDNSEQSKPTTYINDIKEATVEYNQNIASLGQNVIRNQQASPFYGVKGSILSLVEMASTNLPTDTPTWTTIDVLEIEGTELAEFDYTRIFVEDV